MKKIKIANAHGFLGDRQTAAKDLLTRAQDIDFITFDFLAELSMSIMALEKKKGRPAYAKDFPSIIQSLVPFWNQGLNFKVVANAGGLDPKGCAEAVREALQEASARPLNIAYILGDDVLELLQTASDEEFPSLDRDETIAPYRERLVSANAYIGSDAIKEALDAGADIVVAGRVADPSLTVGPCLHAFQWSNTDLDKIAQATVAGHLIECGTQVTGGISTKWLDIEDPTHMGFPIAVIHEDGLFSITKPEGTGGLVSVEIVKEQLLYEIGDPDLYISPDLTVSFTCIEAEETAKNCVEVRGAKGRQPTDSYKVVATYQAGFRAEAMLVIFGDQAFRKGRKLGQVLLERVREQGFEFDDAVIECLGSGEAAPGRKDFSVPEIVLRIAVRGSEDALQCFAKEIAPLVTSGPQGVAGYASGRPKIRPVFQHYPTLISKEKVQTTIYFISSEGL
ncbi:acyclic terpene utilization AtuA family protein [Estrella lausannensis]|uniref:Acyclic terpene utilisation N-terminal domain-containing protein n=1 Tax=Estrella lausannensis TaxID=483423 RepID=A0A0H5DR87_9BACT|nr:acyclic terpene utilization AtuA family protein [Estrella lausannensis]CRX39082.1 Conserved hypothetical protein [Estrella lausannensis]